MESLFIKMYLISVQWDVFLPLVLVSEEAHIHLVVLSLQDLGRPVTKALHLGPHHLMAGHLNWQNYTHTSATR